MNQNEYKMADNFYGKGLLHTPEGVRDIYGLECARKLSVQEEIHQTMKLYGFQDIQTPSFEFFDIFSKERGTVQSRDMYKFFDRGNNTLVLRPDITPALARCVAKYFKEETLPVRFCYVGNTYFNVSRYQGKLQEVTQVGAEVYNDKSSDVDAEMIAMTIECLLKSGLKEFQLEVGHAEFFQGLVEEAGISEEEESELRQLIEAKNFFGVQELLDGLSMDEDLKNIFLKLPELSGDYKESVAFVKKHTDNHKVLHALDRMEKVEKALEIHGVGQYVTFDLSMLSTYSYYTGIVFRAYTYGNGEAIATGGRYDGLVKQFGKEAPAIGVAIVLDQLMLALNRQNLFTDTKIGGTLLVYPKDNSKEAIALAEKLRKGGDAVQMLRESTKKEIEEYVAYAKRMKICRLVYLNEKDHAVVYENGKEETVSCDSL